MPPIKNNNYQNGKLCQVKIHIVYRKKSEAMLQMAKNTLTNKEDINSIELKKIKNNNQEKL